jgi:hypothetical protein
MAWPFAVSGLSANIMPTAPAQPVTVQQPADPVARVAVEANVRRFDGRGYALLACPHDATAEYPRPHVCELFPAEYPAHDALVDSTISAGTRFFFWLARIDYFVSA